MDNIRGVLSTDVYVKLLRIEINLLELGSITLPKTDRAKIFQDGQVFSNQEKDTILNGSMEEAVKIIEKYFPRFF